LRSFYAVFFEGLVSGLKTRALEGRKKWRIFKGKGGYDGNIIEIGWK